MKWPAIGLLLAAMQVLNGVAAAQSTTSLSGVQEPPPVHVRWIVDLKKNLQFQDFSRLVATRESWKSQQGISFLSPDEVVIYQLAEGGTVNDSGQAIRGYLLRATVLDAHDGHEIKSLQFPLTTDTAKLLSTRAGAFLVRTGDVLSLYSSKFEPVSSRKLPSSKDTSVDEWQVDVSPSGAQVILVHRQVWNDAKGTEKDSRADVEVLDAETFKTVKSFSVPWMDQWSAGDNLIITEDPDDEESGATGILDFTGKWRRLKTSAENDNAACPYHLEPLEHQLFVAHDCDDLVVVSASGVQKFSQSIRGQDVLVSVAGADRYLAEALVEPQHSRAYISVYDLRRKAQVSWISLEKKSIYYSISPSGSVAAIDGDRIKFFDPALSSEAIARHPQLRWATELVDKYGYDSFDRDTSLRWARQQDVRFITPDEIAVYQVKQNENTPGGEGDTSGKAAGFYLQAKIFSAHDAHEIKTLRLPATAQFTKLIPTHDGKFILRIGDVVNLYSANFEQLAWRSLPLDNIAGTEGWQVDVSPSGREVLLVHQKRFAVKSLLLDKLPEEKQDHADIEVLDADTFQPVKKFTVKSLRDNWSASDGLLVAAGFDDAGAFGALDFDGKWKELKAPSEMAEPLCPTRMQALPQQQVAVLGCSFFAVLSNMGQGIFSARLRFQELSSAAGGSGTFVAVEIDKLRAGKRFSDATPVRIEVYDLITKTKAISVPLTAENPYFDVSSRGELAVVENDSLSLYVPIKTTN